MFSTMRSAFWGLKSVFSPAIRGMATESVARSVRYSGASTSTWTPHAARLSSRQVSSSTIVRMSLFWLPFRIEQAVELRFQAGSEKRIALCGKMQSVR
jgi:hypothetical protein